jgi:abortive infection bacteriophage resistance protein
MAGFLFGSKMAVDYTKPPLTYQQQVELLKTRGLVVTNSAIAAKFFTQVNYYRFSAYCIPFQSAHDVFSLGITFEKIVELYRLDEILRNDYLEMLSPIEVFLRTRIVYELSHGWGPFSHYDPSIFRTDFDHAGWIAALEEEVNRGKEDFLDHYKTKYNGFPKLPIWMACEIMSLGSLSHLYHGLLPDPQRQICAGLDIHNFVLQNWLHNMTYLRNICAHHSRLWNRELSIRPFIPNKNKRWVDLHLDPAHLYTSIAIAEWVYRKADLDLCNIGPVYDTMQKIAVLDPRFAAMMGGPAGKAISLCWVVKP